MFWLGLSLALVSSVAVNWAYALEHDAAAALPPLSFRQSRESLRLLFGARAWLRAFALESAGWLVYVLSLRLAPLALVQAVSAAGIAVLAFVSCHGRVGLLSKRERAAVVIAFAGLVLLGLSLRGMHQSDHAPSAIASSSGSRRAPPLPSLPSARGRRGSRRPGTGSPPGSCSRPATCRRRCSATAVRGSASSSR